MVKLYRREKKFKKNLKKKREEVQVKTAEAVDQALWTPRAGSNQWYPVLHKCRETPPHEERNG